MSTMNAPKVLMLIVYSEVLVFMYTEHTVELDVNLV